MVMAVFVRRSSAIPISGKVVYFFKLSLQIQFSKRLALPSPESAGSEVSLVEAPVRRGSEVYCFWGFNDLSGKFLGLHRDVE